MFEFSNMDLSFNHVMTQESMYHTILYMICSLKNV